jgi:hypothetical protein
MFHEKNYYTLHNWLRIRLRTLPCRINCARSHIMECVAKHIHFKRRVPSPRAVSLDKRIRNWSRYPVETDALDHDGNCHSSSWNSRPCVQPKSPLCRRKRFAAVSILQEPMEGKSSKGMGKMPLLQPHGPSNNGGKLEDKQNMHGSVFAGSYY